MRVSFDLDEALFVSIDTHQTEPKLRFPLDKIFRERLRLGTIELMKKLHEQGVEIWIYTSSFRPKEYIRHLFRHYGITIDEVVNGQRHLKEVQGNRKEILPQKLPNRYGISLHIDDEEVIASYGKHYGFQVFHLDEPDDEWVEKILCKLDEIRKKEELQEEKNLSRK